RADLRPLQAMDLIAVGHRDCCVVLVGNETAQNSSVFQSNLVAFVAIGDLFGRIDQRLGELFCRKPPRNARQVGAENAPLASGSNSAAVARIALQALINLGTARAISTFGTVAQEKLQKLFV